MKKLQINKEHKELIESVIRQNPKFRKHEELMDIFCEAVYKKSYLLIDAIRDKARIRRHLSAISDSCIDQIIKEKLKFEKIKPYRAIEQKIKNATGIVSLKKTILDEQKPAEEQFRLEKARRGIVNLKEEIQRSEKYDSVDGLIDPLEFYPQKRVSQHTLEKLIQIVKAVSAQFPKKRYFEIFSMRYIRKCSQTEIAREIKISQVELSKRFVEMIRLAREKI